jgi:hypothetical protein
MTWPKRKQAQDQRRKRRQQHERAFLFTKALWGQSAAEAWATYRRWQKQRQRACKRQRPSGRRAWSTQGGRFQRPLRYRVRLYVESSRGRVPSARRATSAGYGGRVAWRCACASSAA